MIRVKPKRVIHIHAGLPKTGSSAIQRFLVANRAALGGRGLLIPEAGLGERGDHHDWMFRLGGLDWWDRRRAVSELVADLEARPEEEILISSEFAYLMMRFGFARHGYRILQGKGFALKFHLFLRPQTDFAVSAHPEFLRNLLVERAFPRFVETNFLPFARDYGEIVRRLERVSGEPVSVLPYAKAARGEGVWWSLLASTGLDVPAPDRAGFEAPGEVNPSLGPVGVMALTSTLRRIDRRAMMTRWGLRRAVRLAVLRVTGNFPPEAERYNPMTPGQRAALWEACRDCNEGVARDAWNRPWDEVFAAEKAAAPRRLVYLRGRDDEDSPAARLHDRLARRLFRKIRQKTQEVAAKRAQGIRLRQIIGSPVDRMADRAMRMIVRGW